MAAASHPEAAARKHGRWLAFLVRRAPGRRLLVERQRSRRWMFRGGRPNGVARLLNRVTITLVAAGLSPKRLVVLEVEGRRTGRRLSTPVVVADVDGERFLVSMLGEKSQWIHNVRAARGRAVIRRGRRAPVQLEEVPDAARARVLKRYLALAPGARAHIPVNEDAPLREFERVAGEYPVFHIGPAASVPTAREEGDEVR